MKPLMPSSAPKGRKLNWQQACELIGCSKTHFYSLVNSGRLPGFRTADKKRGLWVWEADCLALREPSSSLG